MSKYKYQQPISADIDDEYIAFKVITFTIPFYKHPFIDILQIFIPLALITLLTLFTFAQSPDFNDKIGNIATLMIVYVGIVNVMEASLPPTTFITLIDVILYLLILINVLCLVRGYTIKDYSAADFKAFKVFQDPMFLISMAIAIVCGLILIFLLVLYCYNLSAFNMEENDLDSTDKKLDNWVSPHLWNKAREQVLKDNKKKKNKSHEEEKKEDPSRTEIILKTNSFIL